MKKISAHICNRNGFTYLMALILIVIMGIMLGAVGQTWQTTMKREREAELLFRGSQIKAAITTWHTPGKGRPPSSPLTDLKQLLEDPRTVDKVRYLRKLYTDPITGKEWGVVKDAQRGITGVFSSSDEKPLKVDNFPDDLKDLAGKEKYSDWRFVYAPTAATAGPQGAAGASAQPVKK
jgi:type II secretory pathway pseudopilin PulG